MEEKVEKERDGKGLRYTHYTNRKYRKDCERNRYRYM
jgi:hypothetical protein